MWCYISGEAPGEIWNLSLLGWKELKISQFINRGQSAISCQWRPPDGSTMYSNKFQNIVRQMRVVSGLTLSPFRVSLWTNDHFVTLKYLVVGFWLVWNKANFSPKTREERKQSWRKEKRTTTITTKNKQINKQNKNKIKTKYKTIPNYNPERSEFCRNSA